MPQTPIIYCIYKQLSENVLLLSNQENLRAKRERGFASSAIHPRPEGRGFPRVGVKGLPKAKRFFGGRISAISDAESGTSREADRNQPCRIRQLDA